MESTEKLLVVIFDINPHHWSKVQRKDDQKSGKSVFETCLESLLVFCNSYLMFNHSNRLAFLACHSARCEFVYPVTPPNVQTKKQQQTQQPPQEVLDESELVKDGKFESFMEMNHIVSKRIKEILQAEAGCKHQDTLLSGAFTKSLCYIHSNGKTAIGLDAECRVLILTASPDVSAQYMSIMNCIFAAQKKNVMIDTCSVNHQSGFLQQAADITSGVYKHVEDVSGLLEYLLFMYLPDASMRKKLELPASVEIDYRAACFCHKQLVDVGFVCSICLSIYCQPMPKCSTCQTRFKPPSLPALKGKKKKK